MRNGNRNGACKQPNDIINAHGVVVSLLFSMWEVLGSIPSVSMLKAAAARHTQKVKITNRSKNAKNNTGYSSVGRASDCRRLQQSDGHWFDSEWPDICKTATPETNSDLHTARQRAHPDLSQGPADLQSAALTTELCTWLLQELRGRKCLANMQD